MASIYVSGPVIRSAAQWDLLPWVQQTYESLANAAQARQSKALLPHVDGDLEQRKPIEFFHAVKKQVCGAEAFVGVFAPGDVSTAIEASIASAAGKKILLVVEDGQDVPRLLEGLPGTVGVLHFSELGPKLNDYFPRLFARSTSAEEKSR